MRWTIRGLNPSRSEGFFSSPKRPNWLWGPPSLLLKCTGILFCRKSGQSVRLSVPASSVELKNEWSCTLSFLYALWRRYGLLVFIESKGMTNIMLLCWQHTCVCRSYLLHYPKQINSTKWKPLATSVYRESCLCAFACLCLSLSSSSSTCWRLREHLSWARESGCSANSLPDDGYRHPVQNVFNLATKHWTTETVKKLKVLVGGGGGSSSNSE